MDNDDRRKERRLPTNGPALVFSAENPRWTADAVVENVSANGLLVRMSGRQLALGSELTITIGTLAVAGRVRHLSQVADQVLVGIAIDDVMAAACG